MNEAVEQRMSTTKAAHQDRYISRCVNTLIKNMGTAQICKFILGKFNAAGSYDILRNDIHAQKMIHGRSAHLSIQNKAGVM